LAVKPSRDLGEDELPEVALGDQWVPQDQSTSNPDFSVRCAKDLRSGSLCPETYLAYCKRPSRRPKHVLPHHFCDNDPIDTHSVKGRSPALNERIARKALLLEKHTLNVARTMVQSITDAERDLPKGRLLPYLESRLADFCSATANYGKIRARCWTLTADYDNYEPPRLMSCLRSRIFDPGIAGIKRKAARVILQSIHRCRLGLNSLKPDDL